MRRLFVHTVAVKRYPNTVTDYQRDRTAPATVQTALACLIEPRPSVETASPAGRITQGDHLMTWGEEDVRASDLVEWGSRKFIVRRIIPDISRPFSNVPPYQVAELQEQVAR